jgi:hypothetical protein
VERLGVGTKHLPRTNYLCRGESDGMLHGVVL